MTKLSKLSRILSDASTTEGRLSLLSRVTDRMQSQIPPSLSHSHVLESDVLGSHRVGTLPTARPDDARLTIGWVITPPIAGSGGHTTAFRMVSELEKAGHTCELVLYDVFGGDVAEREAVIRRGWPHLKAAVRSIDKGFAGFDACVATGWQTACALAARAVDVDMHRFYFIQDFEPFFYPHGYEYALAESTYRLDLNRIALGEMVSSHVRAAGGPCLTVPFGCDTETYHLLPGERRDGIVFYSRAGTTRRGFLLASMGLEEFNRRRPLVPIKVFGPLEKTSFAFPVEWQGLQTPTQLNALYNTSIAGLGMSFTNISLVVGEMLSAGCVPLVNDSPDARLDMASPYVRWVNPDPMSLADELVDIVDNPPQDTAAVAGSAGFDWRVTQKQFVSLLTSVVWGRIGVSPA